MHHLKQFFLTGLMAVVVSGLSAQTTGCLSGNCINGIGTYLFTANAEYTGQWVNGSRTGVGCYDWADGSFYYGYFQNGKLEGNGFYIGNDEAKTTLVGIFRDGKLSEERNFGTSGCLIGNCYNGVGIYLWTNDDIYVGEWMSGNRTGYGRFDWADGSFYTGYFKDGLLDGKGYYEKSDGTIMDGYFEKNVFTKDSKATDQSAIPYSSSTSSSAKNYSYVTYDDICPMLQEVIKGFPDNFSTVMGKKNEDGLILDTWQSTVSMKGGIESGLLASLLDDDVPAMWYNKVYEFTDAMKAMNKYNDLLSNFANCRATCCSFSQRKESKENERYTTYFEPSYVNSGYSYDYNDMQVVIELTYSTYTKTWSVELQVVNKNKF